MQIPGSSLHAGSHNAHAACSRHSTHAAHHSRLGPHQGSARLRSTRLGRNRGPSASAQHLSPRAAGHAGHTHTKQCARPAAGRRANECARTRPSCSASLPPLSAAGERSRRGDSSDADRKGHATRRTRITGDQGQEGGGHDSVVRDGGGRNGHDGGGHNGYGLAGDGYEETITWRW